MRTNAAYFDVTWILETSIYFFEPIPSLKFGSNYNPPLEDEEIWVMENSERKIKKDYLMLN